MHLLAATPGAIEDGAEPVDLGQTPGDIIVLSAADTELAGLAAAYGKLESGRPTARLANLMHLAHPFAVDTYLEQVVSQARLVVVRLLGGLAYWRYGAEEVAALCRERGTGLAIVPGDDRPDPELAALGTLPAEAQVRLWRYLVEGGPANHVQFWAYGASLIGAGMPWLEPQPLDRMGFYGVSREPAAGPGRPRALIVFYRALLQGGALAPIDSLLAALRARGFEAGALFVTSLKDAAVAESLAALGRDGAPDVVLNATGFAVGPGFGGPVGGPLAGFDCPVLQVVLSGGTEEAWRESARGLGPRDLAMNVVLPELDGRVLSRAVSFKAEGRFDADTQCSVVTYRAVPDRVEFAADLALAWARLRRKQPAERRLALVLANYPNRDGRLANGVGLDTPASTVALLGRLAQAGYRVEDAPADAALLMDRLRAGPTNRRPGRTGGVRLSLAGYEQAFGTLPAELQQAVTARWGAPGEDPFFADGDFWLPLHRLGQVWVGIQPARGYNLDPKASYHDPDLLPPHGYFAFYFALRHELGVDAVVHVGKHGNLEWLPGKALALSRSCVPEAALGPLPHLYPFIVNDPGEGTQAKRRAQAVIIDHLTPAMTRAESYGPLAELEGLVDEYFDAAGLDPRRLKLLGGQIIDASRALGLDKDCGIGAGEDLEAALAKLDEHLCDLKELQIRDGLHILGQAPEGRLRTDMLAALLRVPRGTGVEDGSLLRALWADLELGDGDPLDRTFATLWQGPQPPVLARLGDGAWRTAGDTVERLELLMADLLSGRRLPEPGWSRTRAILERGLPPIAAALDGSGAAELAACLHGLAGGFVPPGPSGAPTRGRPDTLPTGRNFYSIDSRAVPTPAAWSLGWASAMRLVERHLQDHGDWPRTLALSAWGTANMRTGGDDIAQGLALMGVKPRWDEGSRRVVGFEILPADVLGRPRCDVTLRVSGFFRDAFPTQIDLFDSAARAVAALDEPEQVNPLAAHVRKEEADLITAGLSDAEARRRSGHRVFGAKPGAYGAGLQALMDEGGWRDRADLADAFVAWGGYAYGGGSEGDEAFEHLTRRLAATEIVVHNQDNREHDLLDSDDYYQFEGGLAAAAHHFAGRRPVIYHNDHSRPEQPVIRTLEEEIARVVRGRAVNPKWIEGVMRHGYKGAFEMAATVDYLFAFAATTGAVGDHHFDAVFEAYLDDRRVLDFLRQANPDALREMSAKLKDAMDRGLWQARSNAAYDRLADLSATVEGSTAG